MKKIGIIGGGITGMAAALYLSKKGINPNNISIYTDNLGGDFAKGGLKYFHYTPYTLNFIKEVLGDKEYEIQKVNGGVLYKGKIESFPDFLKYHDFGYEIQRMHWQKTRGEESFCVDEKCMNNPWLYNNHLKIVPAGGEGMMMLRMMEKVLLSCDVAQLKVYSDTEIKNIIDTHDLIIFTTPLSILSRIYNFSLPEVKLDNKSLKILRYSISGNSNKLWWDYVYVPEDIFTFHRVSKTNNPNCFNLDLEVNSDNFNHNTIDQQFNVFMNSFNNFNPTVYKKEILHIKGHITTDIVDENLLNIPKNILLLGRFAQWNKRVTFDKILERLYIKFGDSYG
jgi:hypothetical protein